MAEKLEGFDSAPQRLEMCKLQVDDLQKVTTLSSPPISPLSLTHPFFFWFSQLEDNTAGWCFAAAPPDKGRGEALAASGVFLVSVGSKLPAANLR